MTTRQFRGEAGADRIVRPGIFVTGASWPQTIIVTHGQIEPFSIVKDICLENAFCLAFISNIFHRISDRISLDSAYQDNQGRHGAFFLFIRALYLQINFGREDGVFLRQYNAYRFYRNVHSYQMLLPVKSASKTQAWSRHRQAASGSCSVFFFVWTNKEE